MKISVVLAAYKGEKYIAEQLGSILSQLGENDEVIVSDDLPYGETHKAVISLNDNRIKYIEGPAKGVVANFENAMKASTGDIIFLSDQDDVWLPSKVETVMKAISDGADVVLHNAEITDGELKPLGETCFEMYATNSSYIKNLIKNTFVGCCMAFRREVMEECLPMPEGIPMHDWWIALVAIKKGYKVSLIETPLMLWRRHGDNVTGSGTSLKDKIRFRIKMIGCLIPVCRGKDR